MAKTKKEEVVGPNWVPHTQTIEGDKWLQGRGSLPAKIMVIGHHPNYDDAAGNSHFSGMSGHQLFAKALTCGFDMGNAYLTNVVKYMPRGKKPTPYDLKVSRPMLEEEIKRANPTLIICLGGEALKAVMGGDYKISVHRGVMLDHPSMPGVKVFPTYSLSYAQYSPSAGAESDKDWKALADWQNGRVEAVDVTKWTVLRTPEDTQLFADYWLAEAEADRPVLFALDCEWHGKNWMDPNGWLRFVQLAFSDQEAIVIELYDENGVKTYEPEELLAPIKPLLEHPKVALVGHNIIADGEWLHTYDINIQPNTVYDTIIAEHTLDSATVFNLTALTEKYTRMGKYDVELEDWKAANPTKCEDGYGFIPSSIIIPYAARDAIATFSIFGRQYPLLEAAGYTKPRGEHPSLFKACMEAQNAMYEIQRVGMLVDHDRYHQIADAYHGKLQELETQMVHMATSHGLPDFNYRSWQQVGQLLFQVLKLTPVRATSAFDNKPWEKVMAMADPSEVSASTDKRTLDILQDKHPVTRLLRDLRQLDHACKTWLPVPNSEGKVKEGAGLLGKLWSDGRVHAIFSQLKETGRWGSSEPNMQNFPKKAEGDMRRIFGKDKKPADIRSIFIPPPGHVFMEADWKQAELFVLAALSGDGTMMEALTTPGKDLHDLTAISAFSLMVLDEQGNPVAEEYLLDLAKRDIKAFEAYQLTLSYRDQRGNLMTRSAFKNTIRVSAKNLNFGIPYGRGALDIAIQVKAETGTDESIDALTAQIDLMMTAWKVNTYPMAWKYMTECAGRVESFGFIENPWGRRRVFPKNAERSQLAAYKREAQNFPIQSTVADTMVIALGMLMAYRRKHNLNFRIVNQVHDAVILQVPESEIDRTKEALRATMGQIYIPINNAPLKLDIDIDIMSRWGEKIKK